MALMKISTFSFNYLESTRSSFDENRITSNKLPFGKCILL